MKALTKKALREQEIAAKLAAKEAAKQALYKRVKTHPVGIAVEPLLQDAVKMAEDESKKYVESLLKLLKNGNWDLEAVAPYPRSFNVSPDEYKKKLALHVALSKITKVAEGYKGYRRRDEPDFRQPCVDGIAAFIQQDKDQAAWNYEAFQFKLVDKIGECVSATLEGNHVWGYSILTVTKADGSTESWKTQQIVNRSKYGKYFNQYPSRKVK